MCVLQVKHLFSKDLNAIQDFEALTPNLLAHTIETVTGGGLVVLLLSSLQSLTQLYRLTMDIHSRFKTEAFREVTGTDITILTIDLILKGFGLRIV